MGMSPLCWIMKINENSSSYIESVGYQWIQETCLSEGESGIEYRRDYERIWREWIEKYVNFLESITKFYLSETK